MQMVDGYTNGRVTESKKYSCPLRQSRPQRLWRKSQPFSLLIPNASLLAVGGVSKKTIAPSGCRCGLDWTASPYPRCTSECEWILSPELAQEQLHNKITERLRKQSVAQRQRPRGSTPRCTSECEWILSSFNLTYYLSKLTWMSRGELTSLL